MSEIKYIAKGTLSQHDYSRRLDAGTVLYLADSDDLTRWSTQREEAYEFDTADAARRVAHICHEPSGGSPPRASIEILNSGVSTAEYFDSGDDADVLDSIRRDSPKLASSDDRAFGVTDGELDGEFEKTMIRVCEIKPRRAPAFKAWLRNIRKLGGFGRESPGSGGRCSYDTEVCADTLMLWELHRLGITNRAAIRMVLERGVRQWPKDATYDVALIQLDRDLAVEYVRLMMEPLD
jgi:hypothetical protein